MGIDLFTYYSDDRGRSQTLILLHGTGGDEYDLLPLAERFEEYNVLSLRGNVDEMGMKRFFRRTSSGVFDQESIASETGKLARFIRAWMKKNSVTRKDLVFLGYSNGANMILATCFKFPDLFARIVMLHPMLPFEPEVVDLNQVEALVTLGTNDLMIPADESKKVMEVLEKFGAQVKVVEHGGGHEIRQVELEAVEKFLSFL